MSKIKTGGLDQYGADPSNSSSVEQLALKGLRSKVKVRRLPYCYLPVC